MNKIIHYGKLGFSLIFFIASLALFAVFASEASPQASAMAAWVQAVGSIIAIYASARIASYQVTKQRHYERVRAAKDAHRLATFASEVISDATHTIQAVESSQRRWPVNTPYVFHERSRVQAAQALIMAVATDRPFHELIRPAIDMHSLLITVESTASQLEGVSNFKANSRFDTLWQASSRQIEGITKSLSEALGAANLELANAEHEATHG